MTEPTGMTGPAGMAGPSPRAGLRRWHLPAQVLQRYADPTGGMTPSQAASAEAHLDSCPLCRRQLPLPADDVLSTVGAALAVQVTRTPQYRRVHRWHLRWTAGLPLAWLLAALAVCLLAGALDAASHLVGGSGRPPVLLLLAPVLPLLGVAAAWTPQLDPLNELTASTPGAGLGLLLRRTLVVLLTVVPLAALVGGLEGGAPPGLWLLPCLALTALTLAAGSVVGLHRAAGALGAVWVGAVVVPALADPHVPALLQPRAAAGWLAALSVAAAVTVGRRAAYRHTLTP